MGVGDQIFKLAAAGGLQALRRGQPDAVSGGGGAVRAGGVRERVAMTWSVIGRIQRLFGLCS